MAKLNVEKLLKDLKRNNKLVPHINWYQDKQEFPPAWTIEIQNTKEPDPYFHPSSDCFTNPVQLYYEKLGTVPKEPILHPLRRVFDCGHFWHGYYQNILIDMGFITKENVEKQFTKQLSYDGTDFIGRGTLDLLDVTIPGLTTKYIVDIKTMNDKEFDEGPSDRTFQKWEAQVNLYMDWTGNHSAFILAVRKGGTKNSNGRPQHDLEEFTIQYKPELIAEIYSRWAQAQRYIDGVDDVPLN